MRFRCTDEAYERLFRRKERDGDHHTRGERFDEVLRRYIEAIQEENKDRDERESLRVTLTHPPTRSDDPAAKQKHRRLWVDPDLKSAFDALARRSPASAETMIREAIWRFTKSI